METKSNTSTVEQVRIGAAVPRSVRDGIEAIALREDRSIASVIRRALECELEKAAA